MYSYCRIVICIYQHFERFQEFDLRIDEDSYPFLKHAKLEYHDGEGFFLDNPDSHNHSGQNVI